MKKRNLQVMAIVIFTSILVTTAAAGRVFEYEEVGMIQDAMRNLKRVNNMMYSYETSVSYEALESEKLADAIEPISLSETSNAAESKDVQTERVDVWLDQLSGSWVCEYYTTDEDGTRCILKQFCDGRNVYSYVEWNGEWEMQQDADLEPPSLDSLIVMDYNGKDITNIKSENEGGAVKIDYIFTLEYIQELQEKYADMMEDSYEKYLKMQAPEDTVSAMELTAQQYRKTTWENIEISCMIDEQGVYCSHESTVALVQPEIVTDANGVKSLGEKHLLKYNIDIKVLRYNQDGILNKIEQCRNEAVPGF